MAITTLESIRNSTKEKRNFDELRQYPIAIREYMKNKKGAFDSNYSNRQTDTFLQRFKSTRYPITDREYGSPNEEICKIYLNIFQSKEEIGRAHV